MMASVWRPVKGVCIKSLGPNPFLFQFYHELDVERVLKDDPWTFDQHLLIMSPLEEGMNPQQAPLFLVQMWVQIYDLPSGFISKKGCSRSGKFYRILCLFRPQYSLFWGWSSYMGIRVEIDIRKSLKRWMKITKEGTLWNWVNFKCENLSTFCFFCGLLGHTNKFCEFFLIT